jgi:hypothetical protein
MSEHTEVVAEFDTPHEAHAALARLEEHGIGGTVTGVLPETGTINLFGVSPQGPITLAVAPAQAELARQILAGPPVPGEEVTEEELTEEAEEAVSGWICPSCDTEVAQDVAVCPECATPRPEGQA